MAESAARSATAHGRAKSLTPAAAAGGRSITAGRALARVVKLLSTGCIEWFVPEAHHRVGEVHAPVLRHRCAGPENRGRKREGYSANDHNVTPILTPTWPEPKMGATAIVLARFSAKVESMTPTALEKRPMPKSAHSTRCSSRAPWSTVAGSMAKSVAVPASVATAGALKSSARVHSPETA